MSGIHIVAACSECPYCTVVHAGAPLRKTAVCRHPDQDNESVEQHAHDTPDWCPLRRDPTTIAHALGDAMREPGPSNPQCGAIHPARANWCTRLPHHTGDHAACDIVAWPRGTA